MSQVPRRRPRGGQGDVHGRVAGVSRGAGAVGGGAAGPPPTRGAAAASRAPKAPLILVPVRGLERARSDGERRASQADVASRARWEKCCGWT